MRLDGHDKSIIDAILKITGEQPDVLNIDKKSELYGSDLENKTKKKIALYLSEFQGISGSDIFNQIEYLYKGIHYPDLPCSELILFGNMLIEPNGPSKLCSVSKLTTLKFPTKDVQFSVLYDSHRGNRAGAHGTTPSVDMNMQDVWINIIDAIFVKIALALREKNLAYLGNVIHTIQDSFTPAHTQRESNEKIQTYFNDFSEMTKEKDSDVISLKEELVKCDKKNCNKKCCKELMHFDRFNICNKIGPFCKQKGDDYENYKNLKQPEKLTLDVSCTKKILNFIIKNETYFVKKFNEYRNK